MSVIAAHLIIRLFTIWQEIKTLKQPLEAPVCVGMSALPIMSQSSVVGFGNALLLREMRLQGLNISVCVFLQHHFERNNVGIDCISPLFFSIGCIHPGQYHCEDLKV